jgi:Flp pilus assembly protein CpaB
VLGARRPPTGRAVLGGLLVVVAGVGVYAAHEQATASPDTKWLVATHAIAPGSTITPADLGLATMRLGPAASRAFADPADVIGRVALDRVDEGEVLQRSDISAHRRIDPSRATARRLTLALPAGRALGGLLAPGQYVDLLSTGDTAGSTTVVARDALVTAVDQRSSEGIGTNDAIAVSLVVADETTATAVVDANETGKVTVTAASDVELPTDSTDRAIGGGQDG